MVCLICANSQSSAEYRETLSYIQPQGQTWRFSGANCNVSTTIDDGFSEYLVACGSRFIEQFDVSTTPESRAVEIGGTLHSSAVSRAHINI